ncbi:hypothetical protein DTO027B5_2875 [Paecilomyces variotii]|nr:hypothetical protein DTO169C6_1533 [Paecilomyces variotii]KAJ9251819.1 hypothetical protein DTO195F2_7674 [Paecilomyces variotii]KAJ9289886.1 hypothetical protein DTO021C3_2600 [Paecilomyces variotii]KAJ9323631.1 hypothetical protein DTO027B3_5250 [Paecilomyces variotii]KAJ9335458.1 hypothetical protein DTO027B5_2875 [Paecilomyces variotii]
MSTKSTKQRAGANLRIATALWLIVGNSAFSVTARWSLIRSYRDWRRHMLIDQRGLSFLGLDHHEPSPPLSTLAI